MNIKYFKFEDIEGNDIKIEINLDLLRVRVFATTYNFNNEIISKNKIVGWYFAKNKKKFLNILKNNIGNMSINIRKEYENFIDNNIIKFLRCE